MIKLDVADIVIQACIEKSDKLGTLMNIAVVDRGGNLKAFVRQDGAWLGSIEIAQSKASTAVAFSGDQDKQGPLTTEDLTPLVQPGESLYGIQHSPIGTQQVIVFGGGIPLYRGNRLIGAVGVSGSTVENDVLVAQAGADILKTLK